MAKSSYKTLPTPTTKSPPGIWHILTNEAAERFAYYGMAFILFTFMTEYLLGPNGEKMGMNPADTKSYYHLFKAANYAFPIIGALISDIWLGKFKTIVIFNLVYCFGYLALVVDQTRLGLFIGLFLIAVASGIIKPSISANVGDQFGKSNQHLMARIYNWFYFAVNFGAFIGPLLTPLLLYNNRFGPKYAFGLTALVMLFATVVFWMGRKRYVHAPPAGIEFVKECFGGGGLKSIIKLSGLYLFIAMFFALLEQSGSSWIEQAKKLNLHFIIDWKADQVPSFNALWVMILIPLFSYIVYPAMNKIFRLTALRKIGIGMFVAILSFVVIIWLEAQLVGGDVVKYTSSSRLAGLSAVNLIDSDTSSFWVSDRQPTEQEPQELVIKLRENKQWSISSINISLAGALSKQEVIYILKEKGKLVDTAKSKVGREKDTAKIKEIAIEILRDIGESTLVLEEKTYRPKDISIYVGNFTDNELPKIIKELENEMEALKWTLEKAKKKKFEKEQIEKLNKEIEVVAKKLENQEKYLIDNGWKYLKDLILSESEEDIYFEFDSLSATHILVRVKSNYGAEYVRMGEIKTLTNDKMPEDFKEKNKFVWPNVAAAGYRPNIIWQIIASIIITAAELFVSVTSLEFMYSQAPKRMKSFIMSIYLLAIALGNLYAALFNNLVKGTRFEEGVDYFLLWVWLMLGASVLFVIGSIFYKGKAHMQDEVSENSKT